MCQRRLEHDNIYTRARKFRTHARYCGATDAVDFKPCGVTVNTATRGSKRGCVFQDLGHAIRRELRPAGRLVISMCLEIFSRSKLVLERICFADQQTGSKTK